MAFAAYPPTNSQRTRAAALAMVVCRRSPLFLLCILLYRGWCLRRGRAARPYESDAWESPNNSLSQNGYGGGECKKNRRTIRRAGPSESHRVGESRQGAPRQEIPTTVRSSQLSLYWCMGGNSRVPLQPILTFP